MRRNSLYTCLRHYPGGTVGCARCSLFPTTAAFPDPWAGRLPHYLFRGLLSVHSRFGPHTRQVALRPSTPEASEMSLPTSPLRLLPTAATLVGWDSHPLKFRAFSRRTMDGQDEQDKDQRAGQMLTIPGKTDGSIPPSAAPHGRFANRPYEKTVSPFGSPSPLGIRGRGERSRTSGEIWMLNLILEFDSS